MKHYQIEIAGIVFTVSTDEQHIRLSVGKGISGFLVNHKSLEHDVQIHIKSGTPDIKEYSTVYNANICIPDDSLWTIRKKDESYCFETTNDQLEEHVFAITDSTFTSWELFINNASGKIDPFFHPLGSLIIMYSCLAYGGILMHASAIDIQGRGILFAGKSGSGKTTISELFKTSGSEVINDDKIILRKNDGEYFIHNCPMQYADIRKRVPLTECFILSHAPNNTIKPENKISALAAYAIQHNFSSEIIHKQLNNFSEIFANIPIYKLGFFPDQEVVKLLKNRVENNKV